MTTCLNGRLWKWRNFTLGSSRKWQFKHFATVSLDGSLLTLLWDQSFAVRHTTSSWDCPQQWHSLPSSMCNQQTGRDLTKLSQRSCNSHHHTVLTCAVLSRSISLFGGIKPPKNCTNRVCPSQKCPTTISRHKCPKVTQASTPAGTERRKPHLPNLLHHTLYLNTTY